MGPIVAPLNFSFEEINNLLSLDPETGFLYWKQPGRGRQLGKPAGTIDRRGYVTLTINYKRVRAHNLVWLLWTGTWPEQELDHIDHNPSNNRPSNLRDCSASENNFNRKCTNRFGCPGIFQVKKKFRAMHNTTLLGFFETPEQAVAARRNFERKLQDADPR